MFNKLKVKVAEEVKNSHQRLQQFTQSFTDKVENAPSEENFFSIGDDDGQTSSSNTESGFSNVPLTSYSSTPNSGHVRRSSNTSIASDISFLPRYDSPTNFYHMQSDLDVSASEVEDNASTSSQLGHLSKEQIHAAFQKAQQGYHKYRGRYTDVARHYKDLERENTKIRSVLVDTQDKALRRISELREQCSLEQKAKAHLENSLRVDLDEKQYVIDSLKTKVDLLQTNKTTDLDKQNSAVTLEGTNDAELLNSNSILTSDLKDAKNEIQSLNTRIQEMKANSIVFNSKESDFKKKIVELEETTRLKSIELAEVLERERENNLIIAQTKMELHTEIQNRDLEIENLKHDVEVLKSDLDSYETKLKNHSTQNKLENFQTQNTKLIEKVEELTKKCNGYENDLLKIEQFKIENQSLQLKLDTNKKQIDDLERDKIENENTLQQLKVEHEKEISSLRSSAKQHLLTLESKIKNKLENEFCKKEEELTTAFQDKIQSLTEANDKRETQLKLLDQVAETKFLEAKQKELIDIVQSEKERYVSLETNHLELIAECSEIRGKLSDVQKENHELLLEIETVNNENSKVEKLLLASRKESSALFDDKTNLNNEFETIQKANVAMQNEVTTLHKEIEVLKDANMKLQNDHKQNHHNKDDENLNSKLKAAVSNLQGNVHTLQQEKSAMEVQIKTLQDENTDQLGKHTLLMQQSLDLEQQLKSALHEIGGYKNAISEKENSILQLEKANSETSSIQKRLNETLITLKEVETQKLRVEDELKAEKIKFLEEINNLNSEITKFKEHNNIIQGYIDEYKDKLTEYESVSSETTIRIQSLTKQNASLQKEIADGKELLQVSDSINSSLTQQLNKVTEEFTQICNLEGFLNKHIEDKSVGLVDKIKLLLELIAKMKENALLQKEERDNLDIRLNILLNDNKNLNEQLEQLKINTSSDLKTYEEVKLQISDYEGRYKNLNDEIVVLNEELSGCKRKYTDLHKEYEVLQTEKVQIHNELLQMQETNSTVTEENARLSGEVLRLQEVQSESVTEQQDIKTENFRILEEISELKRKNNEVSLDYKQVTAENDQIVQELAETKLKLEVTSTDKIKSEETTKKIELEKAELLNELKQYRYELDKIKVKSAELENMQEIEDLINDNKSLKTLQARLEEKCESYEKQQKVLEKQLCELEKQYTEITHEKQLLQDEIQELKISPINLSNSQKLEDLDIIRTDKILSLQSPNDVKNISDGHQREIEVLNEKLIQYKSLDLTNQSSLQFYENELQKLRNKNEKLNRKLDETLVTLSHCAELSHSTETEYLKNVLYNYMLGKESVVLARVIAAVCKFDESQTNAILQREQHKQTLLGQLGLL